MPLVCLLVAFGIAAPNPLSFGGSARHAFDPDAPGVAGIARHPLLWALALWSASHLVPNGDLAHVLLFGGFSAFSVLGMFAIDRRLRRTLGEAEWVRLARATSLIPLAALAGGRWRPSDATIDAELVLRLLAGAALYLTLLYLHQPIIGVSPAPP
jgi:uncharacterized membrane protein